MILVKGKRKGWGILAGQRIRQGSFITNYVGEVFEVLKRLKREEQVITAAETKSRDIPGRDMYEFVMNYVLDSTRESSQTSQAESTSVEEFKDDGRIDLENNEV